MSETGKVKPEADPVQVALSRLLKVNAGGAAALLALMIGVVQWLDSRIDGAVQKAVSAQEQRITRLEVQMENVRKEKP